MARGPGGGQNGASANGGDPRRGGMDHRLPLEHRALGGLIAGRLHPPSWGTPEPPRAGFFAIKGYVGAVADALRIDWTVEPATEPFLHPGRSARILAGAEHEPVGWIGELHPLVARAYDLADAAAAFEVDLGRLVRHADAVPTYRDLTSFPALRQDLAVAVSDDVPADAVVALVRKAGGDLLADARVFDVYRGAQVGEGRTSLALAPAVPRAGPHALRRGRRAAARPHRRRAARRARGRAPCLASSSPARPATRARSPPGSSTATRASTSSRSRAAATPAAAWTTCIRTTACR